MGKAGFGWAKESNAFTHFMLYHKHIDPKSVDIFYKDFPYSHTLAISKKIYNFTLPQGT